jgi:NAD+ diphosphatase
MTFELNLPLARAAVDRDYLTRERANVLDELAADSATRVLVLRDGLTVLRTSAGVAVPSLHLFSADEAPAGIHRVYLGKTTVDQGDEPAGTPVVLHVLAADLPEPELASDATWHHLRRTGAGLSDRDAGLFAQALAIANWHATHQFCPSCGGQTVAERAGWSRRCVAENRELFPRTDPAIIVAVTDSADRILLGSQGVWEDNRFSILAGFVEPGESLEAAVRREMFEEAGVVVGAPTYLGSQAWPFPYSLMLGFAAQLEFGFEAHLIQPDGQEIEKLRWFSREELVAEAPKLLLPARVSIARAIIERWLGFEIESATELGSGS